MSPKSAVLVPLYLYPLTPETWQPLHTAIATHPELKFIVILNPDSGPGRLGNPSPDGSYAQEIPRLNAQANVCTLGYVRTDYCRRNLAAVCRDVQAYAGWSIDHAASGIFVEGIFLDETPNENANDAATYLETVATWIKHAEGIRGDRLTITNPGTPPDRALLGPGTDGAILFEQSYQRYVSCTAREQQVLGQFERSGAGYILHSVPTHLVSRVVRELRQRAELVFVTDLREHYYEGFSLNWGTFIEAMDAD